MVKNIQYILIWNELQCIQFIFDQAVKEYMDGDDVFTCIREL